jgi:hypothetical protein
LKIWKIAVYHILEEIIRRNERKIMIEGCNEKELKVKD